MLICKLSSDYDRMTVAKNARVGQMTYLLYHNPRCSKSRQALTLLNEHSINPAIKLYLEDAPTVDELKHLLYLLKTTPKTIMRTNESLFKELNLENADDNTLIDAINKHPLLLQRPIVVKNNEEAIIARPPELILPIL